jgi:hypothetical protein
MATTNGRTPAEVRRDIESERAELARAVESLRAGLGQATDVAGKLQGKLPLAAAAAAGAGFVLAGGIGATMRLLARRGREGRRKAKVGRFTIVED